MFDLESWISHDALVLCVYSVYFLFGFAPEI